MFISAVTRIRTWVVSATTRSTNQVLYDHGHCISCFASAMTTIISIRLFNYFKTPPYKYITTFIFGKVGALPHQRLIFISAVTRIRTWVVSATTRSTNHYTITAIASAVLHQPWQQSSVLDFSIILRQLYKYITTLFLQKQLICRTRDSCSSLPWPGFEPGLSRPQREVLTTIRSRPLHQLFCISHDNKSSVLDCSIILRQLRINIYQHLFCKSSWFAEPETHVYLCRDQDSNLGCLGHS